ncbi:hypothetical protein JCGZ_08409 [Jatropha curcas]|uniref:Uncharacterized protein n=1 Tax=Jatropha curcas TaxID=180498 RepID=A0A067KQX2_JATCU|nr:hypothetical protein JCGZ_08409 [Jatropha curcas]
MPSENLVSSEEVDVCMISNRDHARASCGNPKGKSTNARTGLAKNQKFRNKASTSILDTTLDPFNNTLIRIIDSQPINEPMTLDAGRNCNPISDNRPIDLAQHPPDLGEMPIIPMVTSSPSVQGENFTKERELSR